ncbi:MAG: family lipolytic protein [Hymenobacter sp.]|nr:family lipolytic protein [Hymenobacter sp.]
MKLIFKSSAAALSLMGLALTSCQPDIDDPKSSAGQASFTTYIAVGNSLTAGYSDNGLYLEGQQNSYPSILAKQFAQVGGGAFVQPLFDGPNQSNGAGYLKITGFVNGSPTIVPETSSLAVVPGSLDVVGTPPVPRTNLLAKSTVNNQNLGVPGIRVADVQTAGYGLNNPLGFNNYFERLLGTANAASSYQQYVQERVTTLKPTFFTNWLGNNDVLGYASSGGTAAPLTPVAEFTTKYSAITDILTAGGAKGLLATIPNVVNVPYFTTVPTAGIIAQVRSGVVPATTVAGLTAALGLTPTQAASIRFGLFITTTGTPAVREATAADLLLLPSSSVINTPSTTANPLPRGLGIVITGLSTAQTTGLSAAAPPNPLANSLVLDAAEITSVQTRTTELNNVITNIANQKGLALFDSNTFFNGVATNGLAVNAVNNTAAFVTGNLFSLDGVHPTPRGYAVVANEMIKAINAKYGAAVPGVDATQYRGVKFPQ